MVETSTVLPVDHAVSSIKGRRQKEHPFSLWLQQKTPSFCKQVLSNQEPAHKILCQNIIHCKKIYCENAKLYKKFFTCEDDSASPMQM